MNRVPMTAAGYASLQEELRRLKAVDRPRVIKALEEARAHGDLSENAEFEAARAEQGFIEGRIGEIEDKARRADIIDVSKLSGKDIKFGATVKLADMNTDEEVTYQLVGTDEADIKAGLLSITSPLARALIGKRTGDSVEVATPGGERAYEIVRVRYK